MLSARGGLGRFEGAAGDLKPERELLPRGSWKERNDTEKEGCSSHEAQARRGQKPDGGERGSPWGSPRGRTWCGEGGCGAGTAEGAPADVRRWTGQRGA